MILYYVFVFSLDLILNADDGFLAETGPYIFIYITLYIIKINNLLGYKNYKHII